MGGRPEQRNMKNFHSKDWLHQKYWIEGLSTKQIGTICGIGYKTVLYWMKKLGMKRRKPSQAFKGKHFSLEHRRRIGEARKGKYKGRNCCWFGRHHTEESKRKIALTKIGIPRSEEVRRKVSEGNKGKIPWNKNLEGWLKHTEETKKVISEKNKLWYKCNPNPWLGKHHSKEMKQKQSLLSKKRWKNPEFRKKVTRAIAKRPTNPEKIFNEMTPENVRYVGNRAWWRRLPNGKYKNPDFKITGQNKVIEIFGEYWHREGMLYDDPQELIDLYKQTGLDCLIIWENELYDKREVVKEKVDNFMEI